jgi:hypothetical protein
MLLLHLTIPIGTRISTLTCKLRPKQVLGNVDGLQSQSVFIKHNGVGPGHGKQESGNVRIYRYALTLKCSLNLILS